MKKYKLCKDCEIRNECLCTCSDAIEAENRDDSGLHMKAGQYKAKGMVIPWSGRSNSNRMGGLS